MSKLLINEHPLQVLPSLASRIGLNEAIILQQLHYWLENPQTRKERNGRFWVYNTFKGWQCDNFPFWSIPTLKRAFKNLQLLRLVETENFNKTAFDKTLWYSVNYEALDALAQCSPNLRGHDLIESIKMILGECQNDTIKSVKLIQPIPETTRDKIDNDGSDLWVVIQAELQTTLDRPTFQLHFQATTAVAFDGNTLTIQPTAPTSVSWINGRLNDTIKRVASGIAGKPIEIKGVMPSE